MKSPSEITGDKETLVANGILVVDDDPLMCELIRDVLESAEIKSHTTSNSSATKSRYTLDDAKKATPYEGKSVKVPGTLDKASCAYPVDSTGPKG